MLATSTLYPLTARTFRFSYCLEHPLQCIATCYVPLCPLPLSDAKTSSFTLLFVGGISLSTCKNWITLVNYVPDQETWLPLIKEIYRLTSDESCPVHIRSAWVVEQPNHGDSGVLNAKVLEEHYSKMCTQTQLIIDSQSTHLVQSKRRKLPGPYEHSWIRMLFQQWRKRIWLELDILRESQECKCVRMGPTF